MIILLGGSLNEEYSEWNEIVEEHMRNSSDHLQVCIPILHAHVQSAWQ